jgi:hypothetical protein
MKPYGLSIKEFINDSKKEGDLFGLRGMGNLGSFAKMKNVLRRYKKVARRNAHVEMNVGLKEWEEDIK